MERRIGLAAAAVALVAALAGCGGRDQSSGTPDEPTASASATDEATGDPSAGPSGVPSADDADIEALFHAALQPLVDQPVVDFRHDVYSGGALAIETRGRAFQQVGWQSVTTTPKELGSDRPPTGADVKGRLSVRAVEDALFVQLSTWKEPLAGCWLRTDEGQVPGGLLGMTPGVPGFVTVLGAVTPEAVVGQDGDTIVIGGEVPLRLALQLMTTGVLQLLQLDASQLDGAEVPVGVKLTDGVVTDLELKGDDLVSAVRVAGGDVTADAEVTLSDLRVTVGYKPGPADAPVVTAPADDLVMSNDDVSAERGC